MNDVLALQQLPVPVDHGDFIEAMTSTDCSITSQGCSEECHSFHWYCKIL